MTDSNGSSPPTRPSTRASSRPDGPLRRSPQRLQRVLERPVGASLPLRIRDQEHEAGGLLHRAPLDLLHEDRGRSGAVGHDQGPAHASDRSTVTNVSQALPKPASRRMALAAQATHSISEEVREDDVPDGERGGRRPPRHGPGGAGDPARDDDPIPHCPPGTSCDDGVCETLPPPPPSNSPVVSLDTPRQTTNRAAIRIAGRAADADQPATALTVQITVDGVLTRTVIGEPARSARRHAVLHDGAAGDHRRATATTSPSRRRRTRRPSASTAVNVGAPAPTGRPASRSTTSWSSPRTRITYDIAHAQISGASPSSSTGSDHQRHERAAEHDGQRLEGRHQHPRLEGHCRAQGHGRRRSVGIPFVTEERDHVEGSFELDTRTSSTTTSRRSRGSSRCSCRRSRRWTRSVVITKTTLNVPYTLVGDYIYESGAPRRQAPREASSPASTATTSRSGSSSSTSTGRRRRSRLRSRRRGCCREPDRAPRLARSRASRSAAASARAPRAGSRTDRSARGSAASRPARNTTLRYITSGTAHTEPRARGACAGPRRPARARPRSRSRRRRRRPTAARR